MSRVVKPENAPVWWTEARARFTVGDVVHLSADGRSHNVLSPRQVHSGIVIGFSRSGHSVRVRRTGLVAAESYHPDFWDADPHKEPNP